MMKKSIALAALMPLSILAVTSTPPEFTDNLEQAFDAVRGNGKYVYACFSGSDWCGWCKRLETEVLCRPEFLDGVTNDYVLVYIDSPTDTSVLSEHAREENPAIIEHYRITGFPTALIFDENGGIVAKTGYREGGAVKYARHLMEIRTRGPALKREIELVDKYIKPFRTKVSRIKDEMLVAYDMYISEAAARGEDEARARELSGLLLPPFGQRLEVVIEDFRASVLPAEVADLKSRELAMAENFLSSLRAEAARAAAARDAAAGSESR